MYTIVKKNMNAQKKNEHSKDIIACPSEFTQKCIQKTKKLRTSIMAVQARLLFCDVTEVLVRSHYSLIRFQFAEGSIVVNNLIMSKTFRPSIK